MRKKYIMGNWKMNGRLSQVESLLSALIPALSDTKPAECVIFPPAIYIPKVQECLAKTFIQWGAQNIYPREFGAFTGELSAPMLLDYDCCFVLVGHSERRHLFHETEKFIAEKFHHVKEHDMIPVLCVGETLEEREQGLTEKVLQRQLHAICEQNSHAFRQSIVAYEPVWAIGTGKTATPEQAQQAHAFIRSEIASMDSEAARDVSILYGGSVNEKNAKTLFMMPDVDGGLVGGASLNAQQFVEIVECIKSF